jgi:hypothetical protein
VVVCVALKSCYILNSITWISGGRTNLMISEITVISIGMVGNTRFEARQPLGRDGIDSDE